MTYGFQDTNPLFIVEARDLYWYGITNVEPDGSIIIAIFDSGELAPEERKGIVRMKLPLMGIHIVPDKYDPDHKCLFKLTMEFDLCGYIPNWINKIILRDESW